MVTDRADDLKSIVSDNATFIQFPPLGSSTSLITVYGDHRVNIQRTIRSIMQLVSTLNHWSYFILTPGLGLQRLRWIILAPADPIQRLAAPYDVECLASDESPQTDLYRFGGGSGVQKHVFRNARPRARSSVCCQHGNGARDDSGN